MVFNILSLIFLNIAVISIIHKLLFKTHEKEVIGVVTSYTRYHHSDNEYGTVISYTFNGKEYKRHSALCKRRGSAVKLFVDCNNPRKTIYKSNSFIAWYLIVSVICKIFATIYGG